MKKALKDILFLFSYFLLYLLRGRNKSFPVNPERILVISWHLIGDSFSTLRVIASLKKKFPRASLTVLCKPLALDIYKAMPEVDGVCAIADSDLAGRETFRVLRSGYDVVFDLTNNQPSAFLALFARGKFKAGGSGIYHLLGIRFCGFPLLYDRMLKPPADEYITDYLAAIVRLLYEDFTVDNNWQFNISMANQPQALPDINPGNEIHIGFAIGASRNENLWLSSRWLELAGILTAEENAFVYLFGSQAEKALFNESEDFGDDRIRPLIGKISLMESIAKIRKMDYFISNDTGLMHVAIHYKVPTVCLIGPSNPVSYVPKNNPRVRIVKKSLFCQPCYHFLHMAEQTTHEACRRETSLCKRLITVEEVLLALRELKQTQDNTPV